MVALPPTLGISMVQPRFTAFYPVPCSPGVHWVDWFEVLLANSNLLIRCIPVPSFALPEQASTVLLNFGRVIAFRGSADPFNLEDPDIQQDLPRESNRRLTSLFNWSSSSRWVEDARNWYPEELRHFVLCDADDRALGVLTRGGEPLVSLEHSENLPSPWPTSFHSYGRSDA